MNSGSKTLKSKRKVDPHMLSLEGFIRDENNNDAVTQAKESSMQATEQTEENRLLAEEIKKIRKEIIQLREEIKYIRSAGKGEDKVVARACYRKNNRVVYIPKTPLFEKVLERLRQHIDEPLGVTVKRVFETAAKYLGIGVEHEQ